MDNTQTTENTSLSNPTDKQLSCILKMCADQIQRSIQNNNEIEKVHNTIFLIKSKDIQQIYDLVSQRLQNDADKISALNFAVTVASTQENFRKYNNINNFINDIETRDIEPINIQLEWSMLARFSDNGSFEKQTISIIITKPNYVDSDDGDPGEFIFVYKGRPIIGNGAIITSIENTNKIWALDILNHIETWIKKNVKKPMVDKKNQLLYKHRKIVSNLVKVFLEIFPYLLFIYSSIRLYYTPQKQTSSSEQLSFYILICSILAFYHFLEKNIAHKFSIKISNIVAGLCPRSFFILSVEDQEKYDELSKEAKGKGKSALWNIFFPILLNILSSALFVYFFEASLK